MRTERFECLVNATPSSEIRWQPLERCVLEELSLFWELMLNSPHRNPDPYSSYHITLRYCFHQKCFRRFHSLFSRPINSRPTTLEALIPVQRQEMKMGFHFLLCEGAPRDKPRHSGWFLCAVSRSAVPQLKAIGDDKLSWKIFLCKVARVVSYPLM